MAKKTKTCYSYKNYSLANGRAQRKDGNKGRREKEEEKETAQSRGGNPCSVLEPFSFGHQSRTVLTNISYFPSMKLMAMKMMMTMDNAEGGLSNNAADATAVLEVSFDQ